MIVTALVPDPRRGAVVRVLVDGKALGTVPVADARALGLAVGEPLSEATLPLLVRRMEAFSAREAALRVLARRALPSREIWRRLVRRGHGREVAEEAVDSLVQGGLVNDAEFAQHYARTRAGRRSYGPRRLEQDLRRLGVEECVAARAVQAALESEALEPEVMLREAAQRKLRALGGLDAATLRRRLKSYLLRRGFAAEAVNQVVKGAIGG